MPSTAATLVTQTRVREGKDEAFARWQQAISEAAAECRGFIEQTIMPPSPPAQTDWVILQRFASDETAVGWLRSDLRLGLVAERPPSISQSISFCSSGAFMTSAFAAQVQRASRRHKRLTLRDAAR